MATKKLNRVNPSLQDKFWSSVDIFSGDKCWIWIGADTARGYSEAFAIISKSPTFIYFDGDKQSPHIEIKIPIRPDDGDSFIWHASLRKVMGQVIRDYGRARGSKDTSRLYTMLSALQKQVAEALTKRAATDFAGPRPRL